jgi:hypothetical protein
LFLLASVLFGLWLAKPTTAIAPQSNSQDYESGPLVIINDAIYPPSNSIPTEPIKSHPRTLPDNPSQRQTNSGRDYEGKTYSKEEVIQLIKDYSALYSINETLALSIARCESGFNQFAKNKTSTASGVYQYLSSTWKATDQAKIGLSVFDAEANIKAAVSYIASRDHAQPWNASKHCWNK